METMASQIEAVIGVWFKNGRTFYVKRSGQMENYPNAWSLLSIQFAPEEFPDFSDLSIAQKVIDRMSEERLGGIPVRLIHYLKSARCSDNPMQVPVTLHLYEIELEGKPNLNASYYVDSAWFTAEEYINASQNATCGLCMRMWSDYCYEKGLSKTRFAPSMRLDDEH